MPPMSATVVVCDTCGEQMSAEPQVLATSDGGERWQLSCRCGDVTPVVRITARGVQLRGEMRDAAARGDTDARRVLLTRFQREVTRLAPRS